MSELSEIQFEWKYTPADFFKEGVSFSQDGISLLISDGTATAKVTTQAYCGNKNIEKELHDLVESRFLAVQLISHKEFKLAKPDRTEINSNGKKHYYVKLESAMLLIDGGELEYVIRDKDGNIISDSKKERTDKEKWFSEAVQKYRPRDSILDGMLTSYRNSVNDPQNELVHLYEIRDALLHHFGNKNKVLKALSLSKKNWDQIGILANNEPLKEGRHRGKFVGVLRSASKSELVEARKAAVELIKQYLLYLGAPR